MEKKRLNLILPTHLLKTYAKLCIDLGITQTQGITQFLTCVQEGDEERKKDDSCVDLHFKIGKQN